MAMLMLACRDWRCESALALAQRSCWRRTARNIHAWPCVTQHAVAVLRRPQVPRRLQFRHDRFVNFDDGVEMFAGLKQSVENKGEDAARAPGGTPCIRVARFTALPGGHVWGFLQAPSVLPDAVLEALAQLQPGDSSPSTSASGAA